MARFIKNAGVELYYNDTKKVEVTANGLSVSGEILYSNVYSTLANLPNADSHHGMFAHVHAEGRGYFAHAGNWVALANQSELFDLNYNSLNNKPTLLSFINSDFGQSGDALISNGDGSYQFTSYDYNNLVNAPSIPASILDLNITDGFAGQVLKANGDGTFEFATVSGAGGGTSVATSETAPSVATPGDLWYNSTDGTLFIFYADSDTTQWVQILSPASSTPTDQGGGSPGGSSITTGDTAPESPTAGDMWLRSTDLSLYVYYADSDTSQWVEVGGGAGGSGGGASVTVDTTAPSSPSEGDLWYNSTYGDLLIYLGNAWVLASGSAGGASSLSQLTDVDTSTTAPTTGDYLQWDGAAWVPASLPSWEIVDSDTTLTAGQKVMVDTTSSAITITLPASPSTGDEIRIIDAAANASTNNITISNNGNNITGLNDTLLIDADGAGFGLVYFNETRGWIFTEK